MLVTSTQLEWHYDKVKVITFAYILWSYNFVIHESCTWWTGERKGQRVNSILPSKTWWKKKLISHMRNFDNEIEIEKERERDRKQMRWKKNCQN